MESIQQALRSYKALTLKNKTILDTLSHHIHKQKQLIKIPLSQHFQQIKQQYDIALMASKASIDKNIQLQAELEYKQERLRMLKDKLYKNFQEIEGLEFQMKRASGKIQRERKNWQEKRTKQSDQKIKKQIGRLNKKKNQLQKQDSQLQIKQKLKKENMEKLQQEIQETQRRYSQQQKTQQQTIQKLQQQIIWYKQNIKSQRHQSDKSSTPQKVNRSIHLQEMIMKIQHYRNSLDS